MCIFVIYMYIPCSGHDDDGSLYCVPVIEVKAFFSVTSEFSKKLLRGVPSPTIRYNFRI